VTPDGEQDYEGRDRTQKRQVGRRRFPDGSFMALSVDRRLDQKGINTRLIQANTKNLSTRDCVRLTNMILPCAAAKVTIPAPYHINAPVSTLKHRTRLTYTRRSIAARLSRYDTISIKAESRVPQSSAAPSLAP